MCVNYAVTCRTGGIPELVEKIPRDLSTFVPFLTRMNKQCDQARNTRAGKYRVRIPGSQKNRTSQEVRPRTEVTSIGWMIMWLILLIGFILFNVPEVVRIFS